MLPVDPATLPTLVPAALTPNRTPGAGMAFCPAQGLRSGPRAAMAADAGIALGCMVHSALGGLGLGLAALVAVHPGVHDAVRRAGVAYMLRLAMQAWRAGPAAAGAGVAGGTARAFGAAPAVNHLDPKVILFIPAFVPRFCDPARPLLPQVLPFGAARSALGLVALMARTPGLARGLRRMSSGIFAALAARLAWGERA
jgi:threonine/homoserine/homoserine lactone efflux protein